MIRKILILVALLTSLLMIGCRSSPLPTSQVTPSRATQAPDPLTALEAYERVRQSIREWHQDSVVVFISLRNGVEPGGKSHGWGFTIESSSLMQRTEISWVDGDIRKGISDIVGGEISIYHHEASLPLDEMLDSDEAVQIASGIVEKSSHADEPLFRIETERFDIASYSVISPSWELTYGDPDDLDHRWTIIVNALTGKVLRDDFNPPPPTPTSVRPPVYDQLWICAYGEFDLYITNPQDQSLGIEPDSGEPVTEIPDAGYDPDSDIMTEDSIHLASALIMNPAEGRYRLHLHSPGEQEKRCRISVEARKGSGEEVLREVEIPCQGGVSLVYEFTLSLSGDEMVSDIVPVQE